MHAEVQSSNVKCCGYDAESKVLMVTFKGGREYHWHGVDAGAYRAMTTEPSAGKAFHREVGSKGTACAVYGCSG